MKDENKSNKLLLNTLFPTYDNSNNDNDDNCNDDNSRTDNNKNEKNDNGDRKNINENNDQNENKSCEVSGDEVTQNAFEIMMRKIKSKSTFPPTLSSPLTSSNLKESHTNNNNDKNTNMKNKDENKNKNDSDNEVEVEVEDKNLPPSLSSLPFSKQKEWRDNLLYRVCSTLPDLYK